MFPSLAVDWCIKNRVTDSIKYVAARLRPVRVTGQGRWSFCFGLC